MVPPLLGFFSKQFVLYSAIQSGYYFMAIIGILVSVISASYYLKIIKVIHSEPGQLNIFKDQSKIAMHSSPPLGGATINQGLKSKTNLTNIDNTLAPLGIENIHSIFSTTNLHSFMISTLTLSILLFILKPSLLLNSTQLLSLSLFNC